MSVAVKDSAPIMYKSIEITSMKDIQPSLLETEQVSEASEFGDIEQTEIAQRLVELEDKKIKLEASIVEKQRQADKILAKNFLTKNILKKKDTGEGELFTVNQEISQMAKTVEKLEIKIVKIKEHEVITRNLNSIQLKSDRKTIESNMQIQDL